MRNLLLLVSFFTLTPCILIVSIILFAFHSYSLNKNNHFLTLSTKLSNTTITYAALPSEETQFSGVVQTSDARVERLKTFFRLYGSVLEQHAEDFITAADKYNIDYRLLPAIAMQESLGCKREIPNTFNCWGWGIYTKHTTSFQSYPEAIDTISKLLAKNYINKGYDNLEEIQKLYNPSNTNNWSGNINYFINQIQFIL
jgi:beta-N-acetylglucosaminidase